MSWMDDVLANLQSGGAPAPFAPAPSIFPAYKPPPTDAEIIEGIRQSELANQAGAAGPPKSMFEPGDVKARLPFGFAPGAPDMGQAGVQLAMDQAPAGTGVPGSMPDGAPDGSPFGAPAPFGPGMTIPPSVQLASKLAAPSQTPPEPPGGPLPPSAVPLPKPRPEGAPDSGPTDLSAQSRAPAAPMGVPVPAEPSIMQTIMSGLKSASPALLGVGAALQGDQGHLTTALIKQRDDLATQQQAQNLTASALLKAGAPAELVAASVKNPEMLKATIAQYLGKDKFKVVKVKDSNGTERVQLYNEQDGTFKDPPAGVNAPAGPPELTDAQKNRVQAIIDGREQYPSASSRAPDAAMIREAVHTQDPTFDAVNFKSRQDTRTKFTKGKGADNLTAFNTAIGHLGSLESAVDKLNNSGFPAWNKYVANPIAEQFDPKYQSGLKDFQTARTAVADELTRAFRGSGGNVHDIIQWENAINAADSPAALKSAIRSAAELLNSRIAAVGDEYNRGMGTTKDPLELLNPKASESFKRILEGTRPAAATTKGTVNIGGAAIPWSIN